MDKEQREILKELVSVAASKRAASGYMNCDPEFLSNEAVRCEWEGYPEQAGAFRRFRDLVVNPLLGEGWSLDRIEQAAERHFRNAK